MEVRAGLDYLRAEPMREYEERKKAIDTKEKNTKDDKADADDAEAERKADGMMAGVVPGAGRDSKQKLLPVTPWGRYLKVLLSSSEFLFVS
jgi:hypothetical protein